MTLKPYKISALFVIGLSLIILSPGCSSNDLYTANQRYISERKGQIENLPICPQNKFPNEKTLISAKEFKSDIHSIYLFYSENDLPTTNQDITPERIFEPTIKMLRSKGYIVELGQEKIPYPVSNTIQCRFCDDSKMEGKDFSPLNNGCYPFDRKLAEEKCFFVWIDYNTFFKRLASKNPATEKYDAIALIEISYPKNQLLDPTNGALVFETIFLFDKRKENLILYGYTAEQVLRDQYIPPSGYMFGFNGPKPDVGEGLLSCASRGLDKMMSIFPNISGKLLPEEKNQSLHIAHRYQYYIGTRPRQKESQIFSNGRPNYWTFRYEK
jgi:hypothetical protein